jgi:hypothetical protein
MSNDNSTDLLTRTLHDRSERMAGSTLSLGEVKSRARGIRRRRQAMTGAAAAVVLAVAVPVGMTVTDAIDAKPLPPAQQTQTPDPDKTDNAQPQPDFPDGPVTLGVEGLPAGAAPAVNYIDYGAGQLVTPEATYDLPEVTGSIARNGDGWITLGGESEVRWLNADMNVVRTEPSASSYLAVSDDGGQVAWVQGRYQDPEVLLFAAATTGGEPRSWRVPDEDGEVRPVGFLGQDRVVFTIIENSTNGIAEPDGSVTELTGLSVRSASEAAGLIAVQTEYSNARKCDGVVDPSVTTSETVWETCEYQLGEFSPDGRYVIGKVVQEDQTASEVAVLDARTGDVLARFVSDPDAPVTVYQVVWEDADSLLAVTQEVPSTDYAMVRIGLDGSLQSAGVHGTFEGMGYPFGFAVHHGW